MACADIFAATRHNHEPGSYGTRCRQMALMVLYTAPLMMLCDSPSQYLQNMECFRFMAAWRRGGSAVGAALCQDSCGGPLHNAPCSPKATGLEIDKLNRKHVRKHFDSFIGEILRRMDSGGGLASIRQVRSIMCGSHWSRTMHLVSVIAAPRRD